MAESYAPSDWKSALTGRQFERSGMQAYGAAKLFNIMLAKEYSKRLQVRHMNETQLLLLLYSVSCRCKLQPVAVGYSCVTCVRCMYSISACAELLSSGDAAQHLLPQ